MIGIIPSLLEPWKDLARVDTMISCHEMWLDARDWEKPIVRGQGEIRVSSDATFAYILEGVPEDAGHTLRCLNRQRAHPYDGQLRFRLRGIDKAGRHLAFGWTIPSVEIDRETKIWTFKGEVDSLRVDDAPAVGGGTEVLYLLPKHHRSRPILSRFISTTTTAGDVVPQYDLEVLATRVRFTLDDQNSSLTIRAWPSEALPQT